jgi:hypothetical protein
LTPCRKAESTPATRAGTNFTVTPDEERWAEALAIERMFGEAAPAWIAGRIGALALAGDAAGVQRFTAIAQRLEALRTDPDTPPLIP